MKSFEKWEYEEVENTFGLTRCWDHPLLTAWLTANKATTQEALETTDKDQLKRLQQLLRLKVDDWNEQELEVMFIGPLLVLVDYQSPYYSLFFNRRLQAKIDEIEVGGVVDFMLASGKQHPRQPFFCLHEYKRSHGRDNDPLGQLLIAMLSAQTKNDKPHQPLYGLYVEGRFWYFVILKDKTYAVSEPYTATQDDLFIIFKALRKLKGLIEPFIQT